MALCLVPSSRPAVAGLYLQELCEDDKATCLDLLLNMTRTKNKRDRVFPGTNPVSIERCMIPSLSAEMYWAAAKTDGERFLLMAVIVKGRPLALFVDRSLRMLVLGGELSTAAFENSLVDGELVRLLDGSWVFLIFDAIYLSGIFVGHLPFSARLTFAKAWLQDSGRGLSGFALDVKHFVKYGRDKIGRSAIIPEDGLIFVPENESYKTLRNDKLLKWKADGCHTVDFKVEGNKLMILQRNKLVEKAKVGTHEYDGCIVECLPAEPSAKHWTILKTREDKSKPNEAHVFNKTVLNFKEDIKREEFLV